MNSPGVLGLLRHARIVLADPGIDRKRRRDSKFLVEIEKPPHADPHAVFMPAPVRHVRQQRNAGRCRKYLPRHRLGDVPHFQIDDGPDHDAGIARQLEGRTVTMAE